MGLPSVRDWATKHACIRKKKTFVARGRLAKSEHTVLHITSDPQTDAVGSRKSLLWKEGFSQANS